MQLLIDAAALNTRHLAMLLAVFVVVYACIGAIIRTKPETLKVKEQRKKPIYYAGWVIPPVLAAATWMIVPDWHLAFAVTIAAVITVAIGRLDEQRPLTARRQLFWQLMTVITVITYGWTIPYVSNPLGEGVVHLSWITVGTWIIPGSIIAAVWLLFIMNAINWLDGIDGLAGVVALGTLFALTAISLLPSTQDGITLYLALAGAGAIGAFLVWNFPPARVFLGTSGSWFVGLYLGMVAIYGGGKIATALTVLALPVLDAVFVVAHRLITRHPVWKGDKTRHLHYRLRAAGMSARTITLAAAVITAALAIASFTMPTHIKMIVFVTIAVLFSIAFVTTARSRILARKGLHI